MDQTSLYYGLLSVLIVGLPIALLIYSSKAKRKKIINEFLQEAKTAGLEVDSYESLSATRLIGIDTQNKAIITKDLNDKTPKASVYPFKKTDTISVKETKSTRDKSLYEKVSIHIKNGSQSSAEIVFYDIETDDMFSGYQLAQKALEWQSKIASAV